MVGLAGLPGGLDRICHHFVFGDVGIGFANGFERS